MDHYADDLAQVIEALGLTDVSLFGFSTGGGEIARYVGRHGTGRVARLGLISAVPPLMLKTEANPGGLPIDGLRRHPRRQPRRPLQAVPGHRLGTVLRLQPARAPRLARA
jgi:non-heme chloroperoxidase